MQSINLLIEKLKNLNIDENEKIKLLNLANSTQKEQIVSDFKLGRVDKDRSIAVNLLGASVEDLNKQNAEISKKNKLLNLQTEEIEAKNLVLESQKIQLEATAEQLRENLRSLEISYEELEHFSFIASHDLKTPLRSITSFVQLLERKYAPVLEGDGLSYLKFIVEGTSKMNDIINDLVEFSETSDKNAKFLQTDLNEVVKIVLSNLEQSIDKTKAVVLVHKLPVLNVYKSGMVHLFQNLMDNALKFSKDDRPPHIEIKACEDNNTWQFSICDNGLGLEEAFQKKAFQPFQRINHLDRPGTGMGLAICKKIAQIHGGDIWYKSKIGEGSTFNFTIRQKNNLKFA